MMLVHIAFFFLAWGAVAVNADCTAEIKSCQAKNQHLRANVCGFIPAVMACVKNLKTSCEISDEEVTKLTNVALAMITTCPDISPFYQCEKAGKCVGDSLYNVITDNEDFILQMKTSKFWCSIIDKMLNCGDRCKLPENKDALVKAQHDYKEKCAGCSLGGDMLTTVLALSGVALVLQLWRG